MVNARRWFQARRGRERRLWRWSRGGQARRGFCADLPHGENLAVAAVGFFASIGAQPATLVVYCMGFIGEGDTCLDFARAEFVIVLFTIIVVAEGVISLCAEARDRDTSGGLEFTASLPLRMAVEPGHQQVVGIVLFGEMGG